MFSRTLALVVSLLIAPSAARAELSIETFDDFSRYPPTSITDFRATSYNLKADDGTTIALVSGQGLELGTCSSADCVSAFTFPRIARARSLDEFNFRMPIRVDFLGAQQTVGVQVRSDRQYDPPRQIRASLIARTLDGVAIARDDIEFYSNEGWQNLFVVNFFPQFASIKSIEITSTRADVNPDVNYNFLAIDNLEFDRTPQPAGDGRAPHVTINLVNADPFTGDRLVVETNVTDESQLGTVVGHVSTLGPNPVVIDSFEFCGSANTYRCPNTVPTNYTGQTFADLGSAADSTYEAHVTACDIWGNCDDNHVFFEIAKAPLPSPPIIEAVEVSQGVASGFDNTVPGPEDALHEYSPFGIPAYLIQGKNTLVRFYPYSSGEECEGSVFTSLCYSARLAVSIRFADGRPQVEKEFPQNITPVSVSLRPRPFTNDLIFDDLADRRVNAGPGGALNFVIPGSLLRGAETFDFQLRSVDDPDGPGPIPPSDITGKIRVPLREPVALGINAIRIGEPVQPSPETVENRIEELNAWLPVTEVVSVSDRTLTVTPGNCYQVRTEVWATVETETAPRYAGTIEKNITRWVAFVSDGIVTNVACADLEGTQGHTVISSTATQTLAHEIGHSIGLLHPPGHGVTSFIHPTWPYDHGRVGDTDVGIRLDRSGDGESGIWTLGPNNRIFDPCPAVPDSLDTRRPCRLGDEEAATHDIMSQGIPRWWSRLNWNSFYNRMLLLSSVGTQASTQTLSAATESSVDVLLVSGIVDQTKGGFGLVLRKQVPSELVGEPTNPDATLELFGMDGALLQSRGVRLTNLVDAPDSEIPRLFAVVPYVGEVGQLRLTNGETVLLEKQASANAPRVKVLTPNGGEQIGSGIVHVSWEADDADGDPLTFLVQYSPDGGESWQSIGLRSSEDPFEIDFGAGEYSGGANAKIRVLASDGMRLAEDFSDCPFSLRAGTPVTCEVVMDVKPGSCQNPLAPRSHGVISVAILGSDRIDVSAIDVSSLTLAGVTAKRASLKDIASASACDQAITDGVLDLVAHFDAKAVSNALGPVEPGEIVNVTLTGQMETGSASTSVMGTDILTIVPPGQ